MLLKADVRPVTWRTASAWCRGPVYSTDLLHCYRCATRPSSFAGSLPRIPAPTSRRTVRLRPKRLVVVQSASTDLV